jgi:hypothetical protein
MIIDINNKEIALQLQTIVNVCENHGYTITKQMAEKLWSDYSESVSAEWLRLPENHETLWYYIEPLMSNGGWLLKSTQREELERVISRVLDNYYDDRLTTNTIEEIEQQLLHDLDSVIYEMVKDEQ